MDSSISLTLILGMGKTGLAVAEHLASTGQASVLAGDQLPDSKTAESLEHIPLKYAPIWGKRTEGEWAHAFGALPITRAIVSPGVAPSHPARLALGRLKIPQGGDLDLAWDAIGPHPVIAITGTNGKTTTTELIGAIVRNDQTPVFVGGNVGVPWIRRLTLGLSQDVLSVLEVSSYQLDVNPQFRAQVGMITHIEPDHLDRYGSLEAYAASKRQMIDHVEADGFIVLSADNPMTLQFSHSIPSHQLALFSKDASDFPNAVAQAHFTASTLNLRLRQSRESYPLATWKLKGSHNLENLAAAALAARLAGISAAAVQRTIDTFQGVAHRMEWIARIGAVDFYNDSKGTNVGSVLRSLAAFEDQSVVLILGGRNKGSTFEALLPLVQQKCLAVVAYGEAIADLRRDLGHAFQGQWDEAEAFDAALQTALQRAMEDPKARTLLLSPACASWDQFQNFEERGERFRSAILSLAALNR